MAFQPAVREQAKLRLAFCGLSGTGKTMSALAVASAISYMIRKSGRGQGRIAFIDTERGSGSLYAMTPKMRRDYESMSIDDGYAWCVKNRRYYFDRDELTSFGPLSYVSKLREAASAGYDICIADSISHAWSGKGGALELKDNAAARGGNSWTAWRDITPMHNDFVDAMLTCPMHLITTMRMKEAHVQETINGKTAIVDKGLEVIQREGMKYEFTLVLEIDHAHIARVVKTRLDGVIDSDQAFEKPGDAFGRQVYSWLLDGAEPAQRPAPAPQPAPTPDVVDQTAANALQSLGKAETLAELDALIPALKMLSGEALAVGRKTYSDRKAYIMKKIAEQATVTATEVKRPAADDAAEMRDIAGAALADYASAVAEEMSGGPPAVPPSTPAPEAA